MPIWQLALGAAGIVTLAAFAQAISGFGSALVAVPLLSILAGPQAAVVSITILGVVLSSYAAVRERRHVHWRWVGVMGVAGLVGMPIGLLALTRLDSRTLTLIIAAPVLIFAVILATGRTIRVGRRGTAGVAVLSGAMLTSTGMNGPPLVIALHTMKLRPHRFRATLQGVFSIQDVFATVGFLLLGQVDRSVLIIGLAGLPCVPLGWFLGDLVFSRLPVAVFRKVVVGMLVVSALAATRSALAG